MSRQGRILTGQAVLSALILIVVYVTLLRPEGGGSLSGVEAPNGTVPPAGQGQQPQERQAQRQPGDDSNARNRTARTTPGALETPAVPDAGAVTTIEQPTDDQYTDSLGKLRARLGSG
jgi:hypothetical protein